MKRLVFILLFIFLAGLAAGIYYLDTYYLPRVARQKIVGELSRITGGEVTLDSVSVSLWRGLVLSNLSLFDKDDPQKKLASVEEISSFVLFWASLKEKTIILPVIRIKGAAVHLTATADKKLNIAPLMEGLRRSPSSPPPVAVIVKAVSIEESEVFFSDLTQKIPAQINALVEHLNAHISGADITFQGLVQLALNDQKAPFAVSGRYDPQAQRLKIGADGKDLPWAFVAPYLGLLPVTIKEAHFSDLKAELETDPRDLRLRCALRAHGLKAQKEALGLRDVALKADISFSWPKEAPAEKTIQVHLDIESGRVTFAADTPSQADLLASTVDIDRTPQGTDVKMRLGLNNATVQKNPMTLRAVIDPAAIELHLPPASAENQALSYQGVLSVRDGTIEGLPHVGSATELIATVSFEKDAVEIKETSAKILGSPVQVTGSYAEQKLILELAGDFDSGKLTTLLPLPSSSSWDLTGMASVKLRLSADGSKDSGPVFFGEAVLKDSLLTLAQRDLRFICPKGRIKFDTAEQTLMWHFEDLAYRGAPYNFSGNIAGFKTPHINTLIIGKDLRLQADFMKKDEQLDFSSLEGHFRSSLFSLTGVVEKMKSFNLQGTAKVNCEDLREIPQGRAALAKAAPQGEVFLAGHVSGLFEKPRLWKATLKARSKELSLYGLDFVNVFLDYLQLNERGFINTLTFGAYGGKGALKGHLDLSTEQIAYAAQGLLEGINLELLRADTAMKDSKLAGLVDLKASLKGQGKDLNALKGYGTILVKNGNLLEFNPLKGLGNFIFIPRFGSLSFSHAQGDFTIQDGAIRTDDLELIGSQLGLLLEGKMTWAGDLDFVVNTEVLTSGMKEDVEAQEREGKIRDFVNATGGLTAIQVTGTVDKPQYKLLPVGKNIFKKISDVVSAVVPVDVGL